MSSIAEEVPVVDVEKAPPSPSGSDTPNNTKETSRFDAAEDAPVPLPPSANPFMDPKSFPDGGLQAWSTVAGGFLALFVSFGWINCIGVFQNYYESNYLKSYAPGVIAWIPSLEAFMMFSGGPVVGKIYDSYGPRYLILAGTLLHVFGLMMTSLAREYYQFVLAQGICSPIGASMLFYPAINSASTWFHRHRGLSMGIVISGSSLGGVILPIMVQRLIPRIGFPWTMRAAAFLILGCLVFANLTIRSRIPPFKRPFRFMDMIEPFQERTFVLLTIATFFMFWGMYLPFNFVILQAEANGMSPHLSGYLVSILNAASIFGRILPGFIGDRFGTYNVTCVLTWFTCIITLALWIPATTNAPIIAFAALFGFGSGGVVSLPPALIAHISDVRKIGTRTGTLFFVMSFAALTGNPIGGAIIRAQNGAYTHMQIFGGCVMAVGATFYLLARISVGGLNPAKKI